MSELGPIDPRAPLPIGPGESEAQALAALERRLASLERRTFQPSEWGLEPWHIVGHAGEPAYTNSWGALGGEAARFFKDAYGFVSLGGTLFRAGGTVAPAFTLPSGYRPTDDLFFVIAGDAIADMHTLTVETNGQVQYSGTTGYLAPVRFRVI